MKFDRLKRRDFITLIGGVIAWPFAARAQQSTIPVIGYLNSRSPDGDAPYKAGFHRGLKEAGFVEPQNVPSSIVGQNINTIDCPRLRQNWSLAR